MKKQTAEPYLTKRILIRAAARAGKEAAENAMQVAGFNVVARDGKVLRVYADGREEHLKDLPPSIDISKVELD